MSSLPSPSLTVLAMSFLRPLRSFAILYLGLAGYATAQSTWYVDDDAPPGGDGMAWPSAFQNLQDAMSAAGPNDEVRVGAGLYRPDQGFGYVPGDREAYFNLDLARTLIGGYRGLAGRGSPDDRDPAIFESILSGDLLGDDFENPFYQAVGDNSYNVLLKTTSSLRTAEGLVLQSGAAGPGLPGHKKYGGAFYGVGSTLLRDCTFRYNRAQAGGAVYHVSGASLVVENCEFHDNFSTQYGGSLYVTTTTAVTIRACKFLRSGMPATAPEGGAAYFLSVPNLAVEDCSFSHGNATNAGAAVLRQSSGSLVRCVFDRNFANGAQGALYLRDGTYQVEDCRFTNNRSTGSAGAIEISQAQVEVSRCSFVANVAQSGSGGAIFAQAATVRACQFFGNRATPSGGAMELETGEVLDCIFEMNHAQFGGALRTDPGPEGVLVRGCRFACNDADSSGGGVAAIGGSGGSTTILECSFDGNRAQFGGGIAVFDSATLAIVEECSLKANEASLGGGLYASSAQLISSGNSFARNRADAGLPGGGGGGIYLSETTATIWRTTLAYNEVLLGGGAGVHIENAGGAAVDLSTSILWENFSLDGYYQGQQILNVGAALSVDYCCIRGFDGSLGGVGNIWNDPRFWNASQDDYGLRPASPCIDAGDPNLPPDADGSIADMGAFPFDAGHKFPASAWTPRIRCQ